MYTVGNRKILSGFIVSVIFSLTIVKSVAVFILEFFGSGLFSLVILLVFLFNSEYFKGFLCLQNVSLQSRNDSYGDSKGFLVSYFLSHLDPISHLHALDHVSQPGVPNQPLRRSAIPADSWFQIC